MRDHRKPRAFVLADKLVIWPKDSMHVSQPPSSLVTNNAGKQGRFSPR